MPRKRAAGDTETTPSPLRAGLESALVENFDDLTSHLAYADFLTEQGDPHLTARGEFIQVQLALEDPSKPEAERKKLQQQEKQLLQAHGHAWLGELIPHLAIAAPEEGC